MRTQWDSWSRTDLETLRGMLCFCVTCWTCGLGEPCLAGPHAGGTLIVHANESIVYTDGSNGFCWQSELESCATATSTVSTETSIPIVLYVFAAFPAESNPELIAVSFGIEYDAALLSIVESGHCAEIEQHTDEWPLPGSGLVLMWNQPQHERLLELAWFAGVSQADEPSAPNSRRRFHRRLAPNPRGLHRRLRRSRLRRTGVSPVPGRAGPDE